MGGGETGVGTRISHVSHVYYDSRRSSEVHALDDLSLEVRDGEFMCVVGPSGCGKSTLLYIVAGLIKPTKGHVEVDGVPVHGPGPDRGMVFQEYALLPWKTVWGNIELGLKIQKVPKEERDERIRHIIEVVGLQGFESRFPHELSGGMKQRVAVARTLVTRPRVMLMDEPFAAVDAQTRITLQQELTQIWRATRQTILFVTHSVEEAAFLADRVAILTKRPGRVKTIVDVMTPRNRRRADVDREYAQLCNYILEQIRSEVRSESRQEERGGTGEAT